MGAGRTFIAGADIKELEQAAWGGGSGPPDIHDLLRARRRTATKPVVMALHGTRARRRPGAGDGWSLSRGASPDARMGQPEVNLGIIPGAEGTQRLTAARRHRKGDRHVRLRQADCGCRRAGGRPRRSVIERRSARGRGRVCARRSPRRTRRIRGRAIDATDWARRRRTRRSLPRAASWRAKTRRNMLAPLKVVDAIEAAATLPFRRRVPPRARDCSSSACARTSARRSCTRSSPSARVARVPDVPKDTPTPPNRGQWRSSAPARWAAASRWRARTPGLQVVADGRRTARPWTAAWPTSARNYESSVKRGRFTPEEVGASESA